ncbi:transcription factor Jun-like [Pocillopora verrucosa]|uniref:transcription factor jun-D-like n=1 Tax=Pocillopora damicornis TaxID=46731 RepID=UPI000F54EEC8|nr:transcription factor jun-D-like [Pocillopora damicornis]XP_058955848.1 transcription factor JunD-like [Pocillopora verrucosa]
MEETSDTPFYQDEGISSHIISPYLFDKSALHLNLQPLAEDPKIGDLKKHATPSELRSPDLGLLKLGSPELEKMIMSLQGNVTSVSNVSSLFNSNVHAPVNADHDHEPYSRGFTDALQDLHDRQISRESSLIDLADNAAESTDPFLGHTTVRNASFLTTVPAATIRTSTESVVYSSNSSRVDASDFFASNGGSFSAPVKGGTIYPYNASGVPGYTTLYSYPSENPPYSAYQDFNLENTANLRAFASYNNALAQEKTELSGYKLENQGQIVSDHGSLQPIDLEVQEIVKRERKKQRNRIASSKCRKRKLEREARLETRVKELKERNIELNAVANALKQQVCDLKQRVMDHVNEGCQIMLAHQSQM